MSAIFCRLYELGLSISMAHFIKYGWLRLSQVEDDKNLNFKEKYDEDKEIYTDNLHSCEYYEMPDLKNKFVFLHNRII